MPSKFQGSIFTMNGFLNKIERNLHKSSGKIMKKWTNSLISMDAALNRGNMNRTMGILHQTIPIMRDLVPHIRDERLCLAVSNIADENGSLTKKRINLNDVPTFGRQPIFWMKF